MTYKATLGGTSIFITVAFSLLYTAVTTFLLYRIMETSEVIERIVFSCIILGIATHYLVAYLYLPNRYVVDEKHLTIKRLINDVTIPIDEIKDAFIVKNESMNGTERIGGNGGLFGFYGNFKNSFGSMTWYATKKGNYLMIETTDNDRIVITPDNTAMVKELRRLIGK